MVVETRFRWNHEIAGRVDTVGDPVVEEGVSRMRGVLEVSNLTKRFGGLTAVNAVSFVVRRGAIHGLIGPNGSGKSTTFNLITGVWKPNEGRVVLDGVECTGVRSDRVIRYGITRTFQNIELFDDMPVLENCIVGGYCLQKAGAIAALTRPRWLRNEEKDTVRRARAALATVGLEAWADERARNISYGHQRLLEIARALVSEPKVLLLDEPAAGMNQGETQELMKYVERIRDMGITVVLVEHNVRMVMRLCSRITVLNHGEVIAEGTPDELQRDEAVIQAYLGRSTRQRSRRPAGVRKDGVTNVPSV